MHPKCHKVVGSSCGKTKKAQFEFENRTQNCELLQCQQRCLQFQFVYPEKTSFAVIWMVEKTNLAGLQTSVRVSNGFQRKQILEDMALDESQTLEDTDLEDFDEMKISENEVLEKMETQGYVQDNVAYTEQGNVYQVQHSLQLYRSSDQSMLQNGDNGEDSFYTVAP